ncbi:hypothetical protein RYZ27_12005 [Hyphomonas sp. FCG-A18]|uniref:hypothetical protein n=1 Tax=Hyphomonas sp. FCG-A18 TaxID=3080019 RepID=UPI002B30F74B|nr:hypothetical protein RYZ27_12005 [Hyphomonas sp. FCG-A18]
MLAKILPAIIVIVGAAAGGFGAQMLNSSSGSAETVKEKSDDAHGDKDDHGEKDKADDKKDSHSAKKDSHGGKDKKGSGKSASSGDVMYHRFSREFVVPIMRENRVRSMVILNLSIEADSSLSARLFAEEPKVRDNIMTTLIMLSNEGDTLENFTDIESYETIRSMVLKNLDSIFATGIHNILIMDIAKQDL